eukprot:8826803-Ditylum_brightwellii.AAC.1
MHDQNQWNSCECPHGCGSEMEDADHVFSCSKGDCIWQQTQQVLHEWGTRNQALLSLTAAICTGISQWRKLLTPVSPSFISQELKSVFAHQSRLSWRAA